MKISKYFVAFFVMVFLIAPAFAFVAQAQPNIGLDDANATLNLQDPAVDDPAEMVANIVAYLMTFLGLIAIIVILLGGFKWMTAAGNEDKVAEAKKTIIAGCIGLIIILAAYAIVTFVINVTNDNLLA
jgi:heme/copper-type cytochrome/quinol oxidase subunit 2